MKRLDFLRSLSALLLAPLVLPDKKPPRTRMAPKRTNINNLSYDEKMARFYLSQIRVPENRPPLHQDGDRYDEHRENDHILMWRYNASAGKWDVVGHQLKAQGITYTLVPSPWDEPYPQPQVV